MDHFPGTHIVDLGKKALAEGKDIMFHIAHREKLWAATAVEYIGPMAVITNPQGALHVRLDAVLGVHISD